MIKPNTFIIGAQKSATTSVYNWIAQHPDVCGPSALKDFPLFTQEEYSQDKLDAISTEYSKEGYNGHKVVLQGYVNYMFYSSSISNIYSFDNTAKLICVLRNPTDRAISAFNYFKKLNLEDLSFEEALHQEAKRRKGTLREQNNLTYKEHGLYSKQLEEIFKKFSSDQVLILWYEDISEKPEEELVKVFKFLGVDYNFNPDFKRLNSTGKIRFKLLHNLLFNDSKVKAFIIKNIVDPFLPLEKRINMKLAFLNWNTRLKKGTSESYSKERDYLKSFFKEDIIKLEKLTRKNLDHWK